MKFSVNPELLEKFPNSKFGGLFIFGLNNTKKVENIERILHEYTQNLKGENKRLERKSIRNWDLLLENLDIPAEENMPSHKALLKRAISKGEIPSINPLVNSYNYISLKYNIPIGGHDMDKVEEIHVGLTNGQETFTPMNTNQAEEIKKDEYGYIDPKKNIILTRNLVWRQCDQDKISEQTQNVFIPIDDLPGLLSYEEIEKIATELATIVINELGGKAVFGIVNKYLTTIDSDNLPAIKNDEEISKTILRKRMDVITDENKIDEVLTRGVKDLLPETEELKKLMMSGKRLTIYTGIDPTADFIHMGHMIWMKRLRKFQLLGHRVIFLIGGFTAMIGDPDKTYTREPLTKEKVWQNFQNYKKDAKKILDFDWEENPIEIKNNYDWLSKLTLEDWLHIMSNVTLQHVLSHDMFKNRLESETPIRLHETMYPLMQGFDSVHMEVDLEVGGSDQTFNMLTGRILERNILGREKFVLTNELLVDNSGTKMGKTTGNAISFKDSPRDVYGKIMSFSDEMMILAYELLSDISMNKLEEIKKILQTNPMKVKKDLAYEMVELIHTKEDAKKEADNFEKVIQNKEIPSDIKEFNVQNLSSKEIKIIDLLEQTEMVKSRGEAKRLITQGGVEINKEKIQNISETITVKSDTIIKVGKRNWIKLI